jgi:hypothetical protein
MAENIPVYAYTGIYTGILGEKGYMGVFRGVRINFQGLGGGPTFIRMLCKRSHSTDNFIANVLVKILCTYIEFSCFCAMTKFCCFVETALMVTLLDAFLQTCTLTERNERGVYG